MILWYSIGNKYKEGCPTEQATILSLLQSGGLKDWGFLPFSAATVHTQVRSFSRLPENSQTVFLTVIPYYVEGEDDRNLSRYAVSNDYHRIVETYLQQTVDILSSHYPAYRFVPFVDASPIQEVSAAAMAGLGVIGKNHTLITSKYGSYVFIGEIVTDMPVDCQAKTWQTCVSCGRCLSACPTGALTADSFHPSLCLSHISQKKGEWTEEEAELFSKGDLLWGCDCCQDVCPYNQNLPSTYLPEFYINRCPVLTEKNVLDGFFQRAYAWRGQSVILRNLHAKNK